MSFIDNIAVGFFLVEYMVSDLSFQWVFPENVLMEINCCGLGHFYVALISPLIIDVKVALKVMN